MKDLKKDLEGFIINVYPVYQENSAIPIDRFTAFFRSVDQGAIWTALLSLRDENKVEINEGLNQNVTILPRLYQ